MFCFTLGQWVKVSITSPLLVPDTSFLTLSYKQNSQTKIKVAKSEYYGPAI